MPLPGIKVEAFPEIAERLGITDMHVWDLAAYDDEVATSLSVRQVHELAMCTGLGFDVLIGFEPGDAPVPVAVGDFCSAIRTRIAEAYSGIPEYEDAVGWGVEKILQDPGRLYDLANWDCLRDLASSVGIDPVAVLPRLAE